MNARFNGPLFNAAEFNERFISLVTYILYLNTGYALVPISAGDGNIVPPALLYPGHNYLFRLTEPACSSEMWFGTPPSVNYDGMGG